jgi:transcriptional pleiotropic regulator of transition state genes
LKATGMVRPLDRVGRVVVPKELRTTMEMSELDSFEFFVEGEYIILRKYHPGCTFCNSMHDLKHFGSHQVCGYCREDMRKLNFGREG